MLALLHLMMMVEHLAEKYRKDKNWARNDG
jgi:hypothetical protein